MTTHTRTPATIAAGAVREAENRYNAACQLAIVAERMCRLGNLSAFALAALPLTGEISWQALNEEAGRKRFPRPETRTAVIAIVAERLARPAPMGQSVSTWNFDADVFVA